MKKALFGIHSCSKILECTQEWGHSPIPRFAFCTSVAWFSKKESTNFPLFHPLFADSVGILTLVQPCLQSLILLRSWMYMSNSNPVLHRILKKSHSLIPLLCRFSRFSKSSFLVSESRNFCNCKSQVELLKLHSDIVCLLSIWVSVVSTVRIHLLTLLLRLVLPDPYLLFYRWCMSSLNP